MPAEPNLIPPGVAQALLNVKARTTMQGFLARGDLPYLHIEVRRTRLLPAGYIRRLAEDLGGQPATAERIREFNQKESARLLVREAQDELETALSSQVMHTSEEAAKMIGLARMTINRWILGGVLVANIVPRQGRPTSDPTNPLTEMYIIEAAALRSLLRWKVPDWP